jgi:hypothetical protein
MSRQSGLFGNDLLQRSTILFTELSGTKMDGDNDSDPCEHLNGLTMVAEVRFFVSYSTQNRAEIIAYLIEKTKPA